MKKQEESNPLTAAAAIAGLVQGGWSRGVPSTFKGMVYVPVKVGARSPITVYEAVRGQFTGDCAVLVCVAEGDKGLAPLRVRLAAFAAKHDLTACQDPGDPKKKGYKMTCSQVILALEGAEAVVSDHKPKQVAAVGEEPKKEEPKKEEPKKENIDVDALLLDPAFMRKLFARMLSDGMLSDVG